MRILFWGTPEFAVPALRALQEEGHVVVAVVTQPDRPSGRGLAPKPSAVKREAEQAGIQVLQPERPRGEDFLTQLRAMEPELSVVAAYGHILLRELLDLPSRGSLNVHASLLPELRGAAPVNWAIIRGLSHTGVTIMRMVEELDAGPVLYRVATPLPDDISAGELYEMLAEMGAIALVEALAQLEACAIEEAPQTHERATFAPKLDREKARLDWSLSALELDRWVRGCDPWPAAWTTLGGDPVQLFRTAPEAAVADAPPGTVITADAKRGLLVAAREGALRVGEVRPASRARMPAGAWIAGRGVSEGDRFS